MTSKILIGSGILLIVTSLIGTVGGIFYSFQFMKFHENAGIGAVGSGLYFAFISSFLFFDGLLTLIVGLVKFFREKKSKN